MKRLLVVVTTLTLSSALHAAEKSCDLRLTLSDQDHYSGQETVTFDLENRAPSLLRLNFAGGHIISAKINSQPAQVKTNPGRVELSGAALKAGSNTLDIVFEHPYVTDGSGLHIWKDPKDGKAYVYSQLQSGGRDSVFPVLERSGDAPLRLVVDAPKAWTVSSHDESLKAFSLYAGPFSVSEFKSAADTPVRLLVPQSMAESIPTKEWFTTAQMALAYYPWYLKTPYPLKKYDQVVIAPLGDTPEDMARAIFKDIASKWFGKFVAISDADLLTLMAYQGVKEATPFVGAWENFYLNEKLGAYSRAAALREIFFAVGPQAVQEGLAQFFKDFAHKSATIDDVLSSVEKASHKNLKSLKKEWLSTTGINTVTPQYECADGKIKYFSVTQSKPFRSHVSEAALYKNYKIIQTTKISYAQAKTALAQLAGQPCPDAVYLNVEDFDYIKEVFEPNTLSALQTGIENFVDPFFRLKGWMALWNQVQTRKSPQASYADIAVRGLAHERDQLVAQYVLSTLCQKGDEESCVRAKQALPPAPKSHAH
jgi:aminopeptidase N